MRVVLLVSMVLCPLVVAAHRSSAADATAAPDATQAAIQRLSRLDLASQQAFLQRLEQRAARAAQLILAPEETSRREANIHSLLHQKTITWQTLHDVIADTDALEKNAIDQLVRQYRRQVFDSFHKQIDVYGERRQAWLDAFEDWKQAGSRFDQQELLIDWLEAAIRNATPNTIRPIPVEPDFGGPKVARKYRTTGQPLAQKPPVAKPQMVVTPQPKPAPQSQVASKPQPKPRPAPQVASTPQPKPQQKRQPTPQVTVRQSQKPQKTPPVANQTAASHVGALPASQPNVPPVDRSTAQMPRRRDANASSAEPSVGRPPALVTLRKPRPQPPSVALVDHGLMKQPVPTVSVPQPKTPQPKTMPDAEPAAKGIATVSAGDRSPPVYRVAKVVAATDASDAGPIAVRTDELAARIAGCNMAIRALEADLDEKGDWTAARLEPLFDRLKILVLRRHDLELFRQTVSKDQLAAVGQLTRSKGMISQFASRIVAARTFVSGPEFKADEAERRLELHRLEELSRQLAELADK